MKKKVLSYTKQLGRDNVLREKTTYRGSGLKYRNTHEDGKQEISFLPMDGTYQEILKAPNGIAMPTYSAKLIFQFKAKQKNGRTIEKEQFEDGLIQEKIGYPNGRLVIKTRRPNGVVEKYTSFRSGMELRNITYPNGWKKVVQTYADKTDFYAHEFYYSPVGLVCEQITDKEFCVSIKSADGRILKPTDKEFLMCEEKTKMPSSGQDSQNEAGRLKRRYQRGDRG